MTIEGKECKPVPHPLQLAVTNENSDRIIVLMEYACEIHGAGHQAGCRLPSPRARQIQTWIRRPGQGRYEPLHYWPDEE